ncbi:hypothetical protein D3C84_971500 [compost metagenome]
MLLDRGNTIDSIVVGVTFVVGGYQAQHLVVAELSQCQQAHVTIKQNMLTLLVRFTHTQRLNQADSFQ